jgi:hypothetical protein
MTNLCDIKCELIRGCKSFDDMIFSMIKSFKILTTMNEQSKFFVLIQF